MPGEDIRLDGVGERRLQGLWFEDLVTGFEIVGPRRTIAESDIVTFAGLSGDNIPLHVDALGAARTPFRGRVAHGMLVQSVASGLIAQTGVFHGTLAALVEVGIRFRAPVRAGDTLAASLRVREVDPDPGPNRGWVLFDCRVWNQEDVDVIDGYWRVIVRRRPRC